MTINEIRDALADRNLAKVAEATGLHHNTLLSIRAGNVKKPSAGTMALLRSYLQP